MRIGEERHESYSHRSMWKVIFLLFVGPTFNCIIRMLTRHYIKTVDLQRSPVSFGLKTSSLYSTLYMCGNVYTGQTGHSTETRIKDHH
jgi:hypothetical protein